MKKIFILLFLCISNISYASWLQPVTIDPEVALPAFNEIVKNTPESTKPQTEEKSREQNYNN